MDTRFQSTRPSRASTYNSYLIGRRLLFQSTRPSRASTHFLLRHIRKFLFQSTRPSRASTLTRKSVASIYLLFQSTRPSRASTSIYHIILIRNPFQSTRPSRASTYFQTKGFVYRKIFQSTRPSRASTSFTRFSIWFISISIHKALAGLDKIWKARAYTLAIFQSTRPSRASTVVHRNLSGTGYNFNPQGPRGPRHQYLSPLIDKFMISIHKALGKCVSILFQSTRPSRASTLIT